MDGYDNLPFTASPLDAVNAGVNRHDDPAIASGKIMMYELDKHNARMQAYQAETAALSASMAGVQPAATYDAAMPRSHAVGHDLAFISRTNILSTAHLASIIEGRRRQLVFARKNATASAVRVRKVASVVAVVTALIVILGIKMPFIPYRYLMAEYWTSRLLLLASLFVIFKTASTIAKAVTAEEKRHIVLGQCLVEAFKRSYSDKVKVKKNTSSHFCVLDKFEIPRKDLTANFLHQLNKRVVKKTGAAMPYTVYRFRLKELWDCAFFIAPNGQLDDKTRPVADLVPLDDLERLASRPA